MAESVRSKSAFAEENSEKIDEYSTIFQEMNEQVQELLLEARLVRQERQENKDIATKIAAIEAKINNSVNPQSTPSCLPNHQEHRPFI